MTRSMTSSGKKSAFVSDEDRKQGSATDFIGYLIIGNGRVARHIAHYFSLENLPYATWSRTSPRALSESSDSSSSPASSSREPLPSAVHDSTHASNHVPSCEPALATSSCFADPIELSPKIEAASHILLLISDGAIQAFYDSHPELRFKTVVHFSGALVSESVNGAHPLMTFGHELYDHGTYRKIPFVIETGLALDRILPGLKNPSNSMPKELKPLYHALCVMSGNFTTMLWEKVFGDFETKLGLPRAVLVPYLAQTARNLAHSLPGVSQLTGPLVRGDRATLLKHEQALENDPFLEVYRAFANAFRKLNENSTLAAQCPRVESGGAQETSEGL